MHASQVTRAASRCPRCPNARASSGCSRSRAARARELGGVRCGHEPRAAVRDHLERAAGVGRRQHRLLGQERLVGNHPEVLVDRGVVDGEAAGVERGELVLVDAAGELGAPVQPRSRASDSSRSRSGPSPVTTTRSAGSSAAASSSRSIRFARSSRLTERTKSP